MTTCTSEDQTTEVAAEREGGRNTPSLTFLGSELVQGTKINTTNNLSCTMAHEYNAHI